MRADRERWAANAKRNQAQLADMLEADGVLCRHGHEMIKCSLQGPWFPDHFDPIDCQRCSERDLFGSCDYFYHCTTCSRWPPGSLTRRNWRPLHHMCATPHRYDTCPSCSALPPPVTVTVTDRTGTALNASRPPPWVRTHSTQGDTGRRRCGLCDVTHLLLLRTRRAGQICLYGRTAHPWECTGQP